MHQQTSITCANIVGYENANVPENKWQIVPVQFDTTTGAQLDLQDFMTGFTTTVGYEDDYKTLAPCIQIQKRDAQGNILGTGNTSYYFIADAAKDEMGEDCVPGWADESGNYVGDDSWKAAVKLDAGMSVWFRDPQAEATGTMAGQVVSESSTALYGVTATKWVLVANPYPIAFDLNTSKITWVNMNTTVGYEDDYKKDAPCVQIQKRDPVTGQISGTGNTSYYFIADAAKDEMGEDCVPGWADESGNYVGEGSWKAAVFVPAGAGFWFRDPGATENVDITFEK